MVYVLLYLFLLIGLIVFLIKNKPNVFETTYKEAEEKTRFNPTYFLIYDNSTDEKCNRLIVVQPFSWLVWATNNSVYIFDSVSGHQCPLGTSPAIKVTQDIFSMKAECINIVPTALYNLYDPPIRVDYDITESALPNKFTVLDALNILFKKYITADFQEEPTVVESDVLKTINTKSITNLRPPETEFVRMFTRYKPEILDKAFVRLNKSM